MLNLSKTNKIIFNQMKDVYVSEGYSLEEAKNKAINLIIDINTKNKDVKDRLEKIINEHGCLPHFGEIRANYNRIN